SACARAHENLGLVEKVHGAAELGYADEKGNLLATDRDLSAVHVAEAGDPSAVLLRRRAGEHKPPGLSGSEEIVEIGSSKTKLHAARRVLVRRRMERQLRLARLELAPERRLEAELQPDGVTVESNRSVHVTDELDRIIKFHVALPLSGSIVILRMMRHQNQGAVFDAPGLQLREAVHPE